MSDKQARVLVADDNRLTRDRMSAILRVQGYLVETCEDGQQAVELVGKGGIDLVLLDIMMPRLSGLDACRIIKSLTAEAFLPVVLVTVKTDSQSRVEGLRFGADDYIAKPFDETELCARVEAMLRIKRLHDQVAEAKRRLEEASEHDALTGTYNYRHLHSRLSVEFKRAERQQTTLACALLDIDSLQAINDRQGQAAGDALIRSVADLIRRCVRETDVVARFGGDEFVILMPGTHFAGSLAVAERLLRENQARKAPVATFSLGIAFYPSPDVRTKDALLRAADEALFQAKQVGGNRFCIFQQQGHIYAPPPPGPWADPDPKT
ncbi:MAG: diguanylate cyclase [Myxococcales bacterium]|nr:diguanylate cyclase [Polyangiaceae bacterium]MDW8250161.1 diguanylate cyclase [Myxococcales bacterium]